MFFTIFTPPVIIESGGNMNKSVPAFVLGLIFSILGAISSYLFYAVFIIVGTFTGHIQSVISLLPLVNIISFGISFIGSIISLINRKVGGIILIIASIISLICFVVIITSLKLYELTVMLFIIPTLLILLAGILALKVRKNS